MLKNVVFIINLSDTRFLVDTHDKFRKKLKNVEIAAQLTIVVEFCPISPMITLAISLFLSLSVPFNPSFRHYSTRRFLPGFHHDLP